MIDHIMELDVGDLVLSIGSFFAGFGVRDFIYWMKKRKADE